MQVHLARDSVALTAEWPNRVPRARPSVQGPWGPTPLPCIPASFRMSSYGCHMWSRRKADAVFPFVKSRFWKDFSILMARTESLSVKGRGHEEALCCVWMLTRQHPLISVKICWSSKAMTRHYLMGKHSCRPFKHKPYKETDTPAVLMRTCLQLSSSFVSHLLMLIDNTGVRMRVRNGKARMKWQTLVRPSPPQPPSLPVPAHLTNCILGSHDKPDTCQSCTHGRDGEDSSIQSSTCSKLTLSVIRTRQVCFRDAA